MKISKKRKRLIKYINEKINDIEIDNKIDILNIIAQQCGQGVIFEEGTGCRIMFDQLDDALLELIKKEMDNGLKKTLINFDSE